MESKTIIVTALLLSIVLGNIQVEAKSCCPSAKARVDQNICELAGPLVPEEICALGSKCKITLFFLPCPSGYNYDVLENTGDNAAKEYYCKLGCSSSVCGAIATLQNSDASEVVNGAVEKCIKTCSALCTKGSTTAVETA